MDRLRTVFERLLAHFGPQHWWPGEDPFEIMVGAVLTQNTAWSNVERAIANLRAAGALDPGAILAADPDRLAGWLRPSGYFNVKARRLRSLCRWYLAEGGFEALRRRDTGALRRALLAVHGIGPETADDILLYAFERPVFVVDAYTRRLLSRLGLTDTQDYEPLRAELEAALPRDVGLFNEFHALIVQQGKTVCRPLPRCAACCLRTECPFSRAAG